MKLCEGEADLVAHSALAICSWLRFYEPYVSCNYTLSPPLVSGAATPVPLRPKRPLIQHSLMGLSATLKIFPPAIRALHSHFPVFPSALERPNFISPHTSHRWVMSLYFRGGREGSPVLEGVADITPWSHTPRHENKSTLPRGDISLLIGCCWFYCL